MGGGRFIENGSAFVCVKYASEKKFEINENRNTFYKSFSEFLFQSICEKYFF
jgi:hypothetical protein